MAQEASSISALSHPARPARRLSRARRAGIVCLAFLVGILLLLWYVGVFGGNIRTVVPGRVYRSAELTGPLLEVVLRSRHIHTLINLRGGSPEDAWYRDEAGICARLGVAHIDVPFSAVRMPPPEQMQKLLATFDTAAYPILFHCRGGADRSGLAGTLYLSLYQGLSLDQAQARQLTWRYGHLSWGQAHAMDDFLTLYRKTGGGIGLRAWIATRYPALYAALPASEKGAAPDVAPVYPPHPLAPSPTKGRGGINSAPSPLGGMRGTDSGLALSPGL